MKKIVKQVVGIDVAQKELVICLGRMYDDLSPELYANKNFANTPTGIGKLITWVNKQMDPGVEIRYVMEATGVYHEPLAYFLADRQLPVSIILPNKISNYMRTLDTKTTTDKTSAHAIAQFGLERRLDNWVKPLPAFKIIRQLSRERNQVIDLRTQAKNQLHAEKSEAEPNPGSIARNMALILFLDTQEKEIKGEITDAIKKDKEIRQSCQYVCSLPGISIITYAAVIGETNGFDLFRNKRQLTSYAGYDVKEKQSGTSVKGKPKISKRGNKHLRKAMHMPALTAIRHDPRFKAMYARLVAKHGIKMKAAVAVQRKLLEMMYTLFKKQEKYDKEYLAIQKEVHATT